jgi:hypothetical protein
MKPSPRRSAGLQARFEANLAARVRSLFRRHPALCGFSVGEGPSVPLLTQVSVYPASGPAAPPEVCFEVLATLAELVDDCPEAGELLRGRTFARVLH